jgi:hypothetical protein
MNADVRDLLVRLHAERQTGLLSLVIDGAHDAQGLQRAKEALSLSFVNGELAAAEARGCQGIDALDHLSRAQTLLRQRWYPVSSNVLKRMEGMPPLHAWLQKVESDPEAARQASRAQRLDDILRAIHTMGGADGTERFVTLTARHPPDRAWGPLMEALRAELALYLGDDQALAMTRP